MNTSSINSAAAVDLYFKEVAKDRQDMKDLITAATLPAVSRLEASVLATVKETTEAALAQIRQENAIAQKANKKVGRIAVISIIISTVLSIISILVAIFK